jgi:hypothetical protein
MVSPRCETNPEAWIPRVFTPSGASTRCLTHRTSFLQGLCPLRLASLWGFAHKLTPRSFATNLWAMPLLDLATSGLEPSKARHGHVWGPHSLGTPPEYCAQVSFQRGLLPRPFPSVLAPWGLIHCSSDLGASPPRLPLPSLAGPGFQNP